mmetsp:Transcript_10721/g.30152  ORF Transcript_10721/g.30152 Transcript_10721/m.30152 type:complete len:235 (+) Transcript_10721:209-913(+)
MNDALLLVVVIFLLLFLAVWVKSFQVFFGKDSRQNVGADGNQNHEKERVQVAHGREVSHSKDRKSAKQLDQSEELNRPPLDIRNDRDRRTLLGNHQAKDGTLPNLISVQSTNAKVQEQAKEGTAGDPADNTESCEGDKHQQSLTETGPSLLLDVCDHLALDAVLVGLNLARAQCPDVKRSLWDETVPWWQTKDSAGNERDTEHKEIPMIRCGLFQIVLGHLTQNARYVVIDDKQ